MIVDSASPESRMVFAHLRPGGSPLEEPRMIAYR